MPDHDPEPSEAERLLLHLIDVGIGQDGLVCPVCGKHDWDILGLVVAISYLLMRVRSVPPTGKPMMQIVCRTCGYLMHFLWEPIRQKQFPPEALEALRQKVRAIEVEKVPATFEAPAALEGHHGK